VAMLPTTIACDNPPEKDHKQNLIKGLGFSPFRDCQSPQLAKFPSPAELREDVDLIAKMGNAMRTYSSIDGEDTVRYALEHHLRVSVGAWLGPETTPDPDLSRS
jgi:exo-beta-1,3-glucanase (GH17 family)